MSEGSWPLKTGPPQQASMYREDTAGMENQQVRVTVEWLTMPQANTELSYSPRSSSGCPGLQGQTGAEVPGERWGMVAGPCPAAHGWALAGKGFEIERTMRGKKREAQDNMTNWERDLLLWPKDAVDPQCLSVLGTSASIVFLGGVVMSLGVNPPPNDQKSSIPPWWKLHHLLSWGSEILQAREKWGLILHLPQWLLCPSLSLLSFPPPHPPVPITGSNPPVLSCPKPPRRQAADDRN